MGFGLKSRLLSSWDATTTVRRRVTLSSSSGFCEESHLGHFLKVN